MSATNEPLLSSVRKEIRVVRGWAESRNCRRELLNIYLDGRPVDCRAVSDSALCDVCASLPQKEVDLAVREQSIPARGFLSDTLPQELQECELASLQNFLSQRANTCALCCASGIDSAHELRNCPQIAAKEQICRLCLNASVVTAPHRGDCPFKDHPQATCGCCWIPNKIGKHTFHPERWGTQTCVRFSLKIFWLRIRSQALRNEGGSHGDLIEELKGAITVSGNVPRCLVWFFKEAVPLLQRRA